MIFAPCVTFLVVLTLAQAQAPPPRDSAPRAAATEVESNGVIRGRVMDRETGRPIARATAQLTPAAGPGEARSAATDSEGRYQFTGLPAGRYTLTAAPPDGVATHLAHRFGQERPLDFRRSGIGTPIRLERGATFTADVALWRALAIEGRVVDDQGQPVANVPVTATLAGAPDGATGPPRTTDDRGMFRLFGLAPGEYRVCADPKDALSYTRLGPRVSQPDMLLKTCYPAGESADAQPIALTSGEVTAVEVRLRRGRVYTISGIAIDAAGAPTVERVSLVRTEGSSQSSSGVEMKQGTFTVRDVPPGEYGIRAEIGGPGTFGRDKREREVGYIRVTVDGANIENLIVQTARGATVHGRIEFEGERPSSLSGARVVTRPSRESGIYMSGPFEPATIGADDTFQLSGLFGPNTVQVIGLPRPWIVKAIHYRETDIFGRAVEMKSSSDPSQLRVVLTNRSATLTGRVEGLEGRDPATVRVLFYPVDLPSRADMSGILYSMPAGDDGAFKVAPLRAGDYFVVAMLADEVPVMTPTNNHLEKLAKVAERITLAEGEERTIRVRVSKLPQ